MKSKCRRTLYKPPHPPSPITQHNVLTDEQRSALARKMQEAYHWDEAPHPHQLAGVLAQIEGVDAIIQAPTGSGKTAIAAGPHLWLPGMITLMICPLLALEEEMVTTFATDFGLRAVAINSQNGALSAEKIRDILAGVYDVILISPEMVQSRPFVDRLLRNSLFARKVLSIFVDEVHCISHWGADFRKKYDSIAVVRAFLPSMTPVIAVSATLTRRVRRDIESKLQYPKHRKRFHNAGNDRHNVSIVTRAMQHPMHTYADLDFVIPKDITSAEDIPKTLIYADSIDTGNAIIDHLATLLTSRVQDSGSDGAHYSTGLHRGIIRPFNASLSHAYRTEAMAQFRGGNIRIMVCTDAAGMGCNILDIDIVVQWKLPDKFSQWIQRAGRVARGRGRRGLAVLLVERSAYGIVLSACEQAAQPPDDHSHDVHTGVAHVENTPMQPPKKAAVAKARKRYAMEHGLERGMSTESDSLPLGSQPRLNPEAADEGLLTFVQSTTCRREVWAKVFDNDTVTRGKPSALDYGNFKPMNLTDDNTDKVPCCDICDSFLLARTRPGIPVAAAATNSLPVPGRPDAAALKKVRKWRRGIFERDHKAALFGPSVIFDDAAATLAVSVGKVPLETLRNLLKPVWTWWDRYGQELHALLETIDVQYVPIKSPRSRRRHKATKDAGISVYETGQLAHESLQVFDPPLNTDALSTFCGFSHYTVVNGDFIEPEAEPEEASLRSRQDPHPPAAAPPQPEYTVVTFNSTV
ncbi:hypothetical protein NM688_g2307 [Phlebia brevispora]|uniref:Uncharacterized protein n=1 Tax=Phlebia brevispora TaxID=194682 RepID=A0ACC1T994_9APHY|nr:hypothetical protein NM688_g2307 [Phlebia brevispora]